MAFNNQSSNLKVKAVNSFMAIAEQSVAESLPLDTMVVPSSPNELAEENTLIASDKQLIKGYAEVLLSDKCQQQLGDMVSSYMKQSKAEINSMMGKLKFDSNDSSSLGKTIQFIEQNIKDCITLVLKTEIDEALRIEEVLVAAIKQVLFDKILLLPAVEELSEKEQAELALPVKEVPDSTRIAGGMEQTFVLTDNKTESAMPFIGTDKMHSCISPVCHGLKSGKVIVPHIDSNTMASSLINIFAELDENEPFDVYLFGGIIKDLDTEISLTDANQLANHNILQMLYCLYKYAADKNIAVNIRYANIFSKTMEYRNWPVKIAQDETIGVIFNQQGQVLLFKYEGLAQSVPYTSLMSAGFFEGLSKRGAIWLAMRKRMRYPFNQLVKVYDGTDDQWNQHELVRLEQVCSDEIIKILIKQFYTRSMAINLPGEDIELINFLRKYLAEFLNKTDMPEKYRNGPAIFQLINYVTCLTYLETDITRLNFTITKEAKLEAEELKKKNSSL